MQICGDHWINPDQVKSQLDCIDPDQDLVLDISSEGPSLRVLGIIDVLEQHCAKTGRTHDRVLIDRWHNMVEDIPFARIHRPRLSHFFWMSDRYRPASIISSDHSHQVGFFLGRPTLPRQIIMRQLLEDFGDRALVSVLAGSGARSPSIDDPQDWIQDQDLDELHGWWNAHGIPSLDQHCLQDQYSADCNTNADLLMHYGKFDLELVAETYTRGETFFPTEKTVRPISAGKACMIYGPRHYLARLRDLGFRTWHDVWDESYDLLEGAERWRAMRAVLREVACTESRDLAQQCTTIAEHNHQTLLALTRIYRPL